MRDPVYEVGAEDLIEAAAGAGFPGVTKTQLARWHRFGLLPRPKQRSLGRGKGTETVYPRGTAEQLLAICELLLRRRNFDYVREELWWNGYEVKQEFIRERILMAAEWGSTTHHKVSRSLGRYLVDSETSKLFPKLMRAIEPEAVRQVVERSSDEDIARARDEIGRLATALGFDEAADDEFGGRLKVHARPMPPFDSLTSDQKMLLLARWLSVRRFPEAAQWYGVSLLIATIAREEAIWSSSPPRV